MIVVLLMFSSKLKFLNIGDRSFLMLIVYIFLFRELTSASLAIYHCMDSFEGGLRPLVSTAKAHLLLWICSSFSRHLILAFSLMKWPSTSKVALLCELAPASLSSYPCLIFVEGGLRPPFSNDWNVFYFVSLLQLLSSSKPCPVIVAPLPLGNLLFTDWSGSASCACSMFWPFGFCPIRLIKDVRFIGELSMFAYCHVCIFWLFHRRDYNSLLNHIWKLTWVNIKIWGPSSVVIICCFVCCGGEKRGKEPDLLLNSNNPNLKVGKILNKWTWRRA